MDPSKIDELTLRTLAFFAGHPAQVQHFAKVHHFAALLARLEKLPENERFITEAAAIVHDVGILPAREKYGASSGPLQEQEGPPIAEKLLSELAFPPEVIERVSFLVGHHHTYTAIDGLDYQILVEADFLVNFHEGATPKEKIAHTVEKLFRTPSGAALARTMFDL